MVKAGKQRLDVLLVAKGLVCSREKARALILAGQVLVADQLVDKAGTMIPEDACIRLKSSPRFVGRGGDKLLGAWHDFSFPITGLRFLDIGASTGGFTDFLLQQGACQVIAVDVGTNQLDYRLRQDERVTSLENCHILSLNPQSLPYRADGAVMDVSFISIAGILPALPPLLAEEHFLVALFKPQFEVGPKYIGKGGIVTQGPHVVSSMCRVLAEAEKSGYTLTQAAVCKVRGAKGNVEYFFHFRHTKDPQVQAISLQKLEQIVLRFDTF